MTAEGGRPVRVPPRWFVRTAWRAHRALYRVTRKGLWTPAHRAQGAERDRLWARLRTLEPKLDQYAALRSTPTAVIVLAPA